MTTTTKICIIDDCNKKLLARGWCAAHYWRWQKYGSPDYKVKEYELHGLWGHPQYAVWMSMKGRTLNPKHRIYKYYGGRGITVCNRWRDSFSAFYGDMGDKPSKNHSIDRINNDGSYSCGKCSHCIENGWSMNVRWSTKTQQSINQRLLSTNTSGYRGVSYQHGKYVSNIIADGVTHYLGRFTTAEEAALAYNVAAFHYRGEDAVLNKLQ